MIIVKRCAGIGMKYRPPVLIVCLVALFGLLAGCNNRSDVSLTGNTPTTYSHVWITTQEVWFNTNGSAGPGDGGWDKFSLSTPTTIDLVTVNSGNLSNINTGMRVSPATYGQMLIIPLDQSTPLTTSASNAGALYNSEADYVDSTGTTQQLPLEFLNPGQGLGIPTSLKVPFGHPVLSLKVAGTQAAVGAISGNNTSNGTTLGNTTNGTTTGTTTFGSGGTGTSFGIGSNSTQSSQPNNSFAWVEDGTTDLVPFKYGSAGTGGVRTGILLSQHASAYDVSQSGGISGQLTLTNVTTSVGGTPPIQVSAENLTADGSRHQVVLTTTVQSDGSFLLYPLPASKSGTFYDVVIHGSQIATMIIQSVEVTLASSSTSGSLFNRNTGTTNNGSTGTSTNTTNTSTTGTTSTTSTTSTTNSSANNVTAIGTLTPRSATSFTANLATSPASMLPAGSLVKFYQAIRQGEVPYVIEYSPIDPFAEVLYAPQALSGGTIDSGTWSSSGANITVTSAAPAEGTGTYHVAASAPSYNDGDLRGPKSREVKAPAAIAAPPVTVSLPDLMPAGDAVPGTLTATVTAASPGKYVAGQLLISHAGTLVATAPLSAAALSGSGTAVTVSGLPAQTSAAVYYMMVRAWSSNPAEAATIQSYSTPVNMTGSASGSIELTVN
jgi:hypothetical protein